MQELSCTDMVNFFFFFHSLALFFDNQWAYYFSREVFFSAFAPPLPHNYSNGPSLTLVFEKGKCVPLLKQQSLRRVRCTGARVTITRHIPSVNVRILLKGLLKIDATI